MKMNSKKGFTLLEIMVSIAVIGILLSMGFKGYEKITNSAKSASIVDEINKIKVAISSAKSVTGITWGSDSSSGFPRKSPDSTGCNYFDQLNGTNKCDIDKIIETEKILSEELISMGFIDKRDGTGGGSIRSKSLPGVKVKILASAKGSNAIYLEGIPGNIAVDVFKRINGSFITLSSDGMNSARPLILLKTSIDASNQSNIIGDNIINETSSLQFTNLVPSTTPSATPADLTDDFNAAARTPKINLLYFFQHSDISW